MVNNKISYVKHVRVWEEILQLISCENTILDTLNRFKKVIKYKTIVKVRQIVHFNEVI